MVFIRGHHQEADISHWFRPEGDAFVFGVRDGLHESRLHPNADRALELLLALAEHLPPAVDLWLHDWRTDDRWHGEDLANGDVRDALARIKGDLSANAGVEVSLSSVGEQLSLSANLDIIIFARTDRWLYLLQGKGLRRVAAMRQRSWTLQIGEFAPSPAVEGALRATVERLRLTGMPQRESP